MKTFNFKITALSPLHIGSGEFYDITNFVIENDKFYYFDEFLFYKSLTPTKREEFTRKVTNWNEIVRFYRANIKEAKQISKCEIPCSKKISEKYQANDAKFEIIKTFKNPNNFRAILPGSSIKGLLETALGIYVGKITENKIRQALSVSDALMIDGSLEIGITYRVNKKSKEAKIPQNIEVIQKNSTFFCTLKIKDDFPFKDFAAIKKKIESYYALRKDNQNDKATQNSFIARLGRFSGKEYVVDDLKNAKNRYDREISSHNKYNNDVFGWIKFELIDEDSSKKLMEDIYKQEKKYLENYNNRQKAVLELIQKEKEDFARREKELILAKEKKAEEEKKQAEETKQKELEFAKNLAQLSPMEQKVEVIKKEDGGKTSLSALLLNHYNNGAFSEYEKEFLEYLRTYMQDNGEWNLEGNPKKNKNVKRSKEVAERLEKL